jgi:DNA topoisomerase-2
VTRSLFLLEDDNILNYLQDDGTKVEPEYYVPILPVVLMNGSSGIGTGFSSSIPPYDPLHLLKYIRAKIEKVDPIVIDFVPYYEGFKGSVRKIADQKFLIKGKYEKIDENTILITELPIGTWTMNYITFLEELVDGSTDKQGKKIPGILKDISNMSTEVNVHITVVFPKGKLQEYNTTFSDPLEINPLEKLLHLTTTVTTTNMHLFDSQFKLHKYTTVEEIIDAFCEVRIDTYKKRKMDIINTITNKLLELSNRAKYIQYILEGKVDLRRKKNAEVDELLLSLGFLRIEDSFSYLRKMQMDSVTEENVEMIMKEKSEIEMELKKIIATSPNKMWQNDLEVFEKKYILYRNEREKLQSIITTDKPKKDKKNK